MSQFHELTFPARFAAMGDKAESAFFALHPNAHRLGLSRPAMSMAKMPAAMRYTPDFMVEDAAVEVMGFSSRGNAALKLKCEKLDALHQWDMLMPVRLWVFDSAKHRYWSAPIAEWTSACHNHADKMFFTDNLRPYHHLPMEHFPSAPVALEPR